MSDNLPEPELIPEVARGDPMTKQFVGLLCAVLALAGATEIVINIITMRGSSFYIGAWYTGLLSLIVGVNGVMLCYKSELTIMNARWVCVGAIMCLTFAAFGTTFDGSEYLFFQSLSACASKKSSTSSAPDHGEKECSTDIEKYSALQCVGSEDYFTAAAACATKAEKNGDDVGCTCVADDTGSYPCYEFNGFSSCEYLIYDFPERLHASYLLGSVILFISILIIAFSCRICRATHKDAIYLLPTMLTEPLIHDGSSPTMVHTSCEYSEPIMVDVTHPPFERRRESLHSDGEGSCPCELGKGVDSIQEEDWRATNDDNDGDEVIPILTAVPVNK
jgi:hypothetical protein